MQKKDRTDGPENARSSGALGGDDTATDGGNAKPEQPKEVGGRGGLDPTRYGDWERNGRCIDF